MTEAFLHYIWQHQLLRQTELMTTDGSSLMIRRQGELNRDSGPDFFNSLIEIDSTIWAGNIEIHIRASDWHRHKHSADPAYDNVILHVVHNNDSDVKRKDGSIIPALELEGLYDPGMYESYRLLLSSGSWIPCARVLDETLREKLRKWLPELSSERLIDKTGRMYQCLKDNKRDWEETFYQQLAKSFGAGKNDDAFYRLARATPMKHIRQIRHDRVLLEALLFGQAGFLAGSFTDIYPNRLQREYRHMQNKWKLTPINAASWKLSRMRPANFPSIRIAQLAGLLHDSIRLWGDLCDMESLDQIKMFFSISPSSYWTEHYHFVKSTKLKIRSLGEVQIRSICINTLIPFYNLYGLLNGKKDMTARAINWLNEMPPENNNIIKNWKNLEIEAVNAAESQGLLQLRKQYCHLKRCLECPVGSSLIKV